MVSAYVRWMGEADCGRLGLGVDVWWRYGCPLFEGFFFRCADCVLVAAQSLVCGAPLVIVAGVRTHVMEGTEEKGGSLSTYT